MKSKTYTKIGALETCLPRNVNVIVKTIGFLAKTCGKGKVSDLTWYSDLEYGFEQEVNTRTLETKTKLHKWMFFKVYLH